MTERRSVRNYTSETPVHLTAGRIIGLLARFGAKETTLTYAGAEAVGVSFSIDVGYGLQRYELPVRADRVHAKLQTDAREGRIGRGKESSVEQARRTAWLNVYEMLDAVLSTSETGQTSADEVLFPFLMRGEVSVYSSFVEHQRALNAPEEKP